MASLFVFLGCGNMEHLAIPRGQTEAAASILFTSTSSTSILFTNTQPVFSLPVLNQYSLYQYSTSILFTSTQPVFSMTHLFQSSTSPLYESSLSPLHKSTESSPYKSLKILQFWYSTFFT